MFDNKTKLEWTFRCVIGVLVINVLVFLNTCGDGPIEDVKSGVSSNSSKIDSLINKVETLEKETFDKEEFRTVFEVHGLRTSKRTLYDWNAVVRRAIRPDDRMNEYDERIGELNDRLDSSKTLDE